MLHFQLYYAFSIGESLENKNMEREIPISLIITLNNISYIDLLILLSLSDIVDNQLD